MKEKQIKIKGKRYKELRYQIFNLLFLIGILIEEINHCIPLWGIVPVILAIIVIAALIQITWICIKEENKKMGKPVIRCYKKEDLRNSSELKNQQHPIVSELDIILKYHKIYTDSHIYAEIKCNDFTYDKFIQVYNTEEKIKKLIYTKFRRYISNQLREV